MDGRKKRKEVENMADFYTWDGVGLALRPLLAGLKVETPFKDPLTPALGGSPVESPGSTHGWKHG